MTLTLHALVVEDDPSWQQILEELLTDSGLKVDVVDNLPAAFERLHQRSYRIAVVDLSLSEVDHRNRDGLKILDAIRQVNPRCVSLLLTGYATVELAVSVLTEHGAFTCLRKEMFNRAQFRDIVRQALASAAGPSPDQPSEEAPERGAKRATADDAEEKAATKPLALVVEDDAGWRDILAGLLADAGFEVRLCTGFGEALGYLGRERFGLAVVDLSLTGSLAYGTRSRSGDMQEGYRVLSFTNSNVIPTIVVSGIATPDEVEHVYAEYDVFACVLKQTFESKAFVQMAREAHRAAVPASELADLTDRERQVLDLLIEGMTNSGIAEALVISPNTVKRHLKAIFAKLEVNTRAAAVARALNAQQSGRG